MKTTRTWESPRSRRWIQATYSFLAITLFHEETGLCRFYNGQQRSFVVEEEASDAFGELRTRKAALHENGHAWWADAFHTDPRPELEDCVPPAQLT